MKTVKFAEVVRRAGKPEIHVSWLPPEKDPELARALKQHRVMTIHQHLRGAKKDYGTIGLDRGAPGQILVFPRPLRRFASRRVIAIDYELLPHPPASERSAHFVSSPRRAKPKAPDRAAESAGRNRVRASTSRTGASATADRNDALSRRAAAAGRSTKASPNGHARPARRPGKRRRAQPKPNS